MTVFMSERDRAHYYFTKVRKEIIFVLVNLRSIDIHEQVFDFQIGFLVAGMALRRFLHSQRTQLYGARPSWTGFSV